MPKLIKLDGDSAAYAEDPFVTLADDEPAPVGVGVIVSLARLQAEGPPWLAADLAVGVRLRSDEAVEALAYALPRLAVVALEFPKFRDGRPYTSAALLRERYGYAGEVRAVGDVLVDQAVFMVRCGFTAFEPADRSTLQGWARAAHGFRHVYQAAADRRSPAFLERDAATPLSRDPVRER